MRARRRFGAVDRALAIVAGTLFLAASSADAGKKKHHKDEYGDASASVRAEVAPGLLRAPYLQSLASDSVLVVWDAAGDGQGIVDFGPTPEYGQSVIAVPDGARRVATLRGLAPRTRYFYRVRGGARVLADGPHCCFRTDGGRASRTFSFFVTGDIGSEGGEQEPTAGAILRAEPQPEFGLLVGDIVYGSGRSKDYDPNLMQPWKDLLSQVCVWPVLGNHDWKSDPDQNFRREWYLPNNEHFYSFNWGNAHFVALDSRDGDIYEPEAQVKWLEQDLEAHRARIGPSSTTTTRASPAPTRGTTPR